LGQSTVQAFTTAFGLALYPTTLENEVFVSSVDGEQGGAKYTSSTLDPFLETKGFSGSVNNVLAEVLMDLDRVREDLLQLRALHQFWDSEVPIRRTTTTGKEAGLSEAHAQTILEITKDWSNFEGINTIIIWRRLEAHATVRQGVELLADAGRVCGSENCGEGFRNAIFGMVEEVGLPLLDGLQQEWCNINRKKAWEHDQIRKGILALAEATCTIKFNALPPSVDKAMDSSITGLSDEFSTAMHQLIMRGRDSQYKREAEQVCQDLKRDIETICSGAPSKRLDPVFVVIEQFS